MNDMTDRLRRFPPSMHELLLERLTDLTADLNDELRDLPSVDDPPAPERDPVRVIGQVNRPWR